MRSALYLAHSLTHSPHSLCRRGQRGRGRASSPEARRGALCTRWADRALHESSRCALVMKSIAGCSKWGGPHMAQLSISVRGGQQCAARHAERVTLRAVYGFLQKCHRAKWLISFFTRARAAPRPTRRSRGSRRHPGRGDLILKISCRSRLSLTLHRTSAPGTRVFKRLLAGRPFFRFQREICTPSRTSQKKC